jgi:hypothetical protein
LSFFPKPQILNPGIPILYGAPKKKGRDLAISALFMASRNAVVSCDALSILGCEGHPGKMHAHPRSRLPSKTGHMARPDKWEHSKIRASIRAQDESLDFISAYGLSIISLTKICVVC